MPELCVFNGGQPLYLPTWYTERWEESVRGSCKQEQQCCAKGYRSPAQG